jgi:hypothetical protein
MRLVNEAANAFAAPGRFSQRALPVIPNHGVISQPTSPPATGPTSDEADAPPPTAAIVVPWLHW